MDASELDRVARTHGIVLLLQFGSSVTGKLHPDSDIDLAVLVDRPRMSFDQQIDLLVDLQHLFPEREVDLAILNHADPLFLRKITESCRLLYGDPRRLQRFKIYAFRRYQDHRRFLEMERAFVARRFASRPA